MEKSSEKKTWMSRIITSQTNGKRLAMFAVPLLLFALLAVGGIFATTYAHAAGPNEGATKPGTSKDDKVSKPSPPKDEVVSGTIIKINSKENTLIVRNFQGNGQTTVHINRNTKFTSKGVGRKNSYRDLKVGDFIQVTGPRNKDRDRTIEAKQIVVSKPPSNNHRP